ncbi:MAG: hypothetical protein ACJ8LI_12820, partial [Chthoniobacterales bacterium]
MVSVTVDSSAKSPTAALAHVDDYLHIAQDAGASDVHLGVNAPPIWRLQGTLRPIWPNAPRLTAEETARLADSFLPDLQKEHLAEQGDADFAYSTDFGRFRTSVVRQRLGVDLVFRIINTKVRTMDGADRLQELAEMIGGQRITDTTRAQAQ